MPGGASASRASCAQLPREATSETDRPTAVFPAAARTGRLIAMTRYMTDTAAERASAGHPAHVELTPAAITDPEFLEHVVTCVRRHRAAPALITFAFPPAELWRSRRLIDRLSACGFGLAISAG